MTVPAAALVAEGLKRHRLNELDAAAQLYARALEADPDDAEALHLTGVLAQQRGHFARSVELIQRAIAIRPQARHFTNLAQAYNQLGRSAEAEAAARQALVRDPRSAAAQVNLGVALRSQRRLPAAADCFRAALALHPAYADAFANLGVVLTELGDAAGGEAALREALALNRDGAEAWTALGATLRAQGRLEEALPACIEAARLQPRSAAAHRSLGLLLGALGRHSEAVTVLDQAAALAPFDVAAWIDLGNARYALARSQADPADAGPLYDAAIIAHRTAVALAPTAAATHYNLGLAILDRSGAEAALPEFETAVGLKPDYAEAHCNLGHCLSELGRFEPATAACRRALELKPDLAEAYSTLGNIHVGLGDLAEAEAAYQQAVALRPDLAGGYCNLGVALFRRGRSDEAMACYDRGLALSPYLADAHWNRALALLQKGDFAQGWAEYEWRLKRPRRLRADRRYTQPLWDGTPLDGRHILLHAEQGLGDAIQCVRFVPQVTAHAGRVTLQVPHSLMRLFAGVEGVDALAADDEPMPLADCRLPLFSLPRLFAPAPDRLSWPDIGDPQRPGAYLRAEAAETARWRERLAELMPTAGLRVGIVWSGNRTAEVELGRSIPLTAFAPLAAVPGVRLISLQKGDGLDELDTRPDSMEVAQLGPNYLAGDFAVTAAAMEGLDLVVSCDTSTAHLAGALGKPVWLAINAVADWRWLEARRDSPWYPSLTLYRQEAPGDWGSVFNAMAKVLAGLARG